MITTKTVFALLGAILTVASVAQGEDHPVPERAQALFACFKGLVGERHSYSNPTTPLLGYPDKDWRDHTYYPALDKGAARLFPLTVRGKELYLFDSDGNGRAYTLPKPTTEQDRIKSVKAGGSYDTLYKLEFPKRRTVVISDEPLPTEAFKYEGMTPPPSISFYPDSSASDAKATLKSVPLSASTAETKLRKEIIERIKTVFAAYTKVSMFDKSDRGNQEQLDFDKTHYIGALKGCIGISGSSAVDDAINAELLKFGEKIVEAKPAPLPDGPFRNDEDISYKRVPGKELEQFRDDRQRRDQESLRDAKHIK